MKYILTLFLLFVSVLPAASLSFDEAMSSSKPFVFYMYQDGCSACKYFDSIYDSSQKEYNSKFNFVRQNSDTSLSAKLIEKWNIDSVPFVLVINPKTKRASIVGEYCIMAKDCFLKTLETYD